MRLFTLFWTKSVWQNWLKISKEWEKLGGAPSKLKAAINKGQSIKVSGVDEFNHDSIGTPVAAVVAAALPIIAKLSSFLKAAGVDVDGLIKKGKDAVIDKVTGKLLNDWAFENNDNVKNKREVIFFIFKDLYF